jgi:Transposase domain (DUF772)
MLRIYFMQNWFNLSDPQAEDSLYDIESMRRFAGIVLLKSGTIVDATIIAAPPSTKYEQKARDPKKRQKRGANALLRLEPRSFIHFIFSSRSCLCRASLGDKDKIAVRLTGMEAKRGVRYSPWCALGARQVG